MKRLTLIAALAMAIALPAKAAGTWEAVLDKAKGQIVYFNAWGGGEAINAYIDWAARETESRFGVTVKHVKISDAADAIKRIETENAAGRTTDGGSVDLVWINGENFKTLKDKRLLTPAWAETLPNFALVDLSKPVRVDFSEPVEGLESPWGTAQLTFIADRSEVPQPPLSAAEFMAFAKANPGRLSYPKPPDFHGTTFVKQLLVELAADPAVLQKPVDQVDFESVSKPLWDFLDALHPLLWREGKAFPASAAAMNRMLADRELKMSLTFNPNEGANLVATGQLPETTYSFGFSKGTIGNVHFVAIPANAKAKEGAMVFANFLLSPEAQARKADIKVWGDGTALDPGKLDPEFKAAMTATAKGGLERAVPILAEPHASWVAAIEAEWLKRYGNN